ncbi:MAG: YncE family protein [Myxococcota bacterium]
MNTDPATCLVGARSESRARGMLALIALLALGCDKGVVVPVEAGSAVAPSRTGLVLLAPEKGASDLSVFSYTDGELLSRIAVGEGPHEVGSAPDYRRAVVTGYGRARPGNTISVVDVAERRVAKTISTDGYRRPHDVVFLPDGRRVAVTVEEPGALLVIDLELGTIEKAILTQQDKSHMVALNGDATRAFVANVRSGSVSVIDLIEAKLIVNIPTGAGAEGIAFVASRDEVWVTNREADTVSIVDARSLTKVATLSAPTFPIRARYVRSQDLVLVTAAGSDLLYVFDVERRSLARTIRLPGLAAAKVDTSGRLFGERFSEGSAPIGILLTPDETHALVTNSYADVITVLDLRTWKVERLIETNAEPDGLAWGRP